MISLIKPRILIAGRLLLAIAWAPVAAALTYLLAAFLTMLGVLVFIVLGTAVEINPADLIGAIVLLISMDNPSLLIWLYGTAISLIFIQINWEIGYNSISLVMMGSDAKRIRPSTIAMFFWPRRYMLRRLRYFTPFTSVTAPFEVCLFNLWVVLFGFAITTECLRSLGYTLYVPVNTSRPLDALAFTAEVAWNSTYLNLLKEAIGLRTPPYHITYDSYLFIVYYWSFRLYIPIVGLALVFASARAVLFPEINISLLGAWRFLTRGMRDSETVR